MCKHKWIRLLGEINGKIKPLPIYACLKCGAIKTGKGTITVTGSYLDLPAVTAPTASEGRMYYDSTDKKVKIYDGTAWKEIPISIDSSVSYDVFDGWSDNKLSTRDSWATTPVKVPVDVNTGELYTVQIDLPSARPEWTTDAGTPTVGGMVSLDEGDIISTSSSKTEGTWEIDMRVTATGGVASGNPRQFVFMFEDANNYWSYVTVEEGYVRLYKVDGGTENGVFSGSWTYDTSWHTYKVTRDSSGNFELFVDGVSKGTVTDTWLPTVTKISLGSPDWWNVTLEYDNLKVY